MKKRRISAKEAQNIAIESKRDMTEKKALEKIFKKKLKEIFLKIAKTAFDGNHNIEIYDEDKKLLNYLCHELLEKNFKIEITGFISDEIIFKNQLLINELENQIKNIQLSTIQTILHIKEKLHRFLLPHPEYIETYEFLSSVYYDIPETIFRQDLYSSLFSEKLEIIHGAEKNGLLNNGNFQFPWEAKIKSFIIEIKDKHESAKNRIKEIQSKINDLQNISDEEEYIAISDIEYISDLDFTGIRISWDSANDIDYLEKEFNQNFSVNILNWMSSKKGQEFFDYISEEIENKSSSGYCEIIFTLSSDKKTKSNWKIESKDIDTLAPEIVKEIYSILGFQTEILINKYSIENKAKNFSEIKISW